MQCARVKAALEALEGDDLTDAISALSSWSAGNLLPIEIRSAVCDPIASMTTYISKLADSVIKLKLSGDNTKAITNAQTSSDTLMKTVGCKE